MAVAGSKDRLEKYRGKRNFGVTAEPSGDVAPSGSRLSFVIQKHAASSLHYDFRLELDGVLLSWAVPKGPSFDPADKRMAIHVEDHPLSYGSFEGTIPPKQYGAGTVIVWDNGTWEPTDDPHQGLASGKLGFRLDGKKLQGSWELVRIAKGGEKQEPWLLFKKRDEFARPRKDYDVLTALPDSVLSKTPKSSALKKQAQTAPAEPRSGKTSKAKPKSATPGEKAALPEKLAPQLATLSTGVPATGEWIYEVKFDGYRILTRIDHGKITLFTRGGHDWSARMPCLVQELAQLNLASAWLDGEIVVLGDDGAPDFNRLQKAFDKKTATGEIVYFLFDVPYFQGRDLRKLPLIERRALLKTLLDEKATEHVRFSADFETDPATALASACRMQLEGVIAKRIDAGYSSRRTETWLKLKCKQRQEFVVCGYVDRTDGSPQIGSLLLGVHDKANQLVSVGSVGTGWGTAEATELKRKLARIEVPTTPFAAGVDKPGRWSKRVAGSERWVKPTLVAEVEFAEWTPDNNIRHASYIALRSDKSVKTIRRESATEPVGGTIPTSSGKGAGVKVTHGDRVIDPSTNLTKLDLVRYYESVADWILPHLKGRPVSLVRGPSGVTGELFFQKHDDRQSIQGLKELDADLWPGHPALLEVPSATALANAAQMNVIEFHTWNSTSKAIDKPDRMIFDLDPGEGTKWQHVQEAAMLVRSLLSDIGLTSWLKTSGGKGLHVVVPLTPKLDYDTVKDVSHAVVLHLAKTIPSRFVSKSGAANRVGKVFADYLRNGLGATTATAYSARARPGLGVSMPVDWEELDSLKSGAQWTIATAREYLSFQKTDPWAQYWKTRQTLTAAIKSLDLERIAPKKKKSA